MFASCAYRKPRPRDHKNSIHFCSGPNVLLRFSKFIRRVHPLLHKVYGKEEHGTCLTSQDFWLTSKKRQLYFFLYLFCSFLYPVSSFLYQRSSGRPLVFSLHPPPNFLYLPYSTELGARSLLCRYIHPFGLHKRLLQPAHSSPPAYPTGPPPHSPRPPPPPRAPPACHPNSHPAKPGPPPPPGPTWPATPNPTRPRPASNPSHLPCPTSPARPPPGSTRPAQIYRRRWRHRGMIGA